MDYYYIFLGNSELQKFSIDILKYRIFFSDLGFVFSLYSSVVSLIDFMHFYSFRFCSDSKQMLLAQKFSLVKQRRYAFPW